jgi:acetoin utilization deacetylase AcuC-like enzyme
MPAETFTTSKPRGEIDFIGQSLPFFDSVREALAAELPPYPTIPPIECGLEEFERVHFREYLRALESLAAGEPVAGEPKRSAECSGLEYALPGYRYTLGGMMEMLRRMKGGSLSRGYVFGPVGHHAYPDWGHGYCLLNPQAAAARYAQELGFTRPLIIDWDFHHGDGTQAIFSGDPSVHCISIHSAVDLYMSMIGAAEQGTTLAAERAGHRNIPVLSTLYSEDHWKELEFGGTFCRGPEVMECFDEALENVPWEPDIVFVFSGYDAHVEDCGGDVQRWTDDDFATLTRKVRDYSDARAIPILSTHGGGYEIETTVRAARRHIEALAE